MAAGDRKALLVSANTETEPYPVYPLGLEYVRAALLRAGWESGIWDAGRAACEGPELEQAVEESAPDVVLVSIRNVDNNDSFRCRDYLPDTLRLIERVKAAAGCPVLLGGSGYSLFPREILQASRADAGVAGAGEHVVARVAEALRQGGGIEGIPGALWRTGQGVGMTPPAGWEGFDGVPSREASLVDHYWKRGSAMNLQIQRGCPRGCIYCTYPVLEGRDVRRRRALEAVEEMARLHERHGVDHFFVVDSVFNLDMEAAQAFAAEILRRRLPVKWTAFFVPAGVTEDAVRLWGASGLDGIEFGVDTLSAGLMRRWGKGFGVVDVERAVRACEAAGMPHALYLIFGGPGETEDTLAETVTRAEGFARGVFFAFVGMRVYPGTALHAIAVRDGVVGPDESLLHPRFYVSQGVPEGVLHRTCEALGSRMNWLVVGRQLQKKNRMAAMLRAQGAKGALWQELAPR